ncbi:glycoside hydrolase family 3 N-terminal domain-containing protein [Leifsonia sp. YIM 134122]|uniref:beta-glucosidase n=1 Tax=Leifsonia stereocauli TaxID=3134136 RepID=A0ABU9W1H3_9MICO
MSVRSVRSVRSVIGGAAGLALILSGLVAAGPASAAEPDLARFGTITASAAQNDGDGNFPAENAIDGDATTRWASGNGPDDTSVFTASLTSDLGAVATVTGVSIAWEAAYAASYEVLTATSAPDDDASWSVVATQPASAGGTEGIVFDAPVQARYVRLAMLERVAFTWDPAGPHYYGYSVFTFAVNGTLAVPTVGFLSPAVRIGAGTDAVATVGLSNPSAADQTVRVVSTDGTAVAGTDYTAVDQVVTFPAGETSATVTVPTVSRGALAPIGAFELALSEPSAGITLGIRSTATVTLTPTGQLPNDGTVSVIHDFEDGVPAGIFTWASTDAVKPVLATAPDAAVPGSAADNDVLTATVGAEPTASDWFGFSNDTAATDWSASDGFSFWFRGAGDGGTLSYELKSGGKLFDQNVVDDTAGWREISVLFSSLRVKGSPDDPARFDPEGSTGFAVTLTGLGAGEWAFDDFAVYERVFTLEDFQGDVPISTSAVPVGFFTWGSQEGLSTLGVEARERGDVPDNKVLAGDYLIPSGGYGGFSDNLAASQDWSSFEGIRFWWYASQPSNPASPTAGDDIKVELKDGGPDGEHSELWATTFKDNWGSSTSRWKLVELPFSSFSIGGYQPGSAETQNGTLDLTSAWGFAPTFTPGKPTSTPWAIDDVQLYGTPVAAATVGVSATQDVYLVDAGDAADVGITVTTTSGEPLAAPVTVQYSSGEGSAEADTDYVPFSGELTFSAGSESGSVQSIAVQTVATDEADEARSIPITLESSDASLPDAAPRVVINAHGLPYLDGSLPVDERVADLLGRMSQAEKVGQMAQAERLGLSSPQQIADLGLGSVLSGGGSTPQANTPEAWADMIDGYQRQALSTPLQIPLVYGADAVHGHSNVLDATIFPHNTGLGATRDPALVQQIAEATASETKATGVNWAFAPCLCVTRDERWGRSYESFSEDPALVRSFAEANIVGLQGDDPSDLSGPDKVLATAKHWAGDGGTLYDASKAGTGYPIDQGLTVADSLEDFETLHVDPYIPAIDAGVGTIMPSYSGVDLGDGDVRMHENTLLNTDVLKGDLGFDGFLISDWEGIDKLPGGTYAGKVARSVNSGLDMAMAPYNFGAFITSVTDGVAAGTIAQSRVDDAVTRILQQKFALGLFEDAITDRSEQDAFGGAEHRAIARTAVARSQVLLKNDGVLPLAASDSLYIAGSNADDLGHQMGGWTISWQGASGDITTGTSILEGIRQVDADATFSKDASAPMDGADTGIVVVGEAPYAEGQGDVGNNGKSLSLSAADTTAIDRVCAAMDCVVLVVAGRTQLVADRLPEIDGLVASFLPGSEGAGVADVLFGTEPFTGRLPVTWPATAEQVPINVGDATYEPLFAYGWGVRTDAPRDRLAELAGSLEAGPVKTAVDGIIAAPIWTVDGAVSDPQAAIDLVADAVALVPGTETSDLAIADTLASVVRDLAQAAVVDGTAVDGSSAITADAEHALITGDPVRAVELLASVLGLTPTPPQVVLDDFDRADGRVGANWSGATSTLLYRVKNHALDLQLGGPLIWKEAFGASQEASVTMTKVDPANRAQGLVLKAQPGKTLTTGVIVAYDARAKVVRITTQRGFLVGTSYPAIPANFSDGAVLTARVLADGSVEVLRDGDTIGSTKLGAADRGYFNAQGGHVGIWSLAATRAVFDDFSGGTIG